MASVNPRHKLWLDGRWEQGPETKSVQSSYYDEPAATVDQASSEQMEKALAASAKAFEKYRKVSRFTRSRLLTAMAEGIQARRGEIIERMIREAGKPFTMAEAEVNRALVTFTVAAEETKRIGGEIIPIDIDPAGRMYAPAVSTWVPRGPVLGITPFNFPLNLVAHKVAPALAAGATILIKPAPQAPGPAVILAEIFEKAAAACSDSRDQIPLATFQVVSCSNEVAQLAVTDSRMQSLSFTGSTKVGWMLQQKAVGKKLTLELGGNAAAIVHSDADLARAASRCAFGGYAYAGQSCISVQRIFVQKEAAKKFTDLLVAESEKTAWGDPSKKETFVGPLIDRGAADRVMAWIEEAKGQGARILTGGSRQGNVIAPTVLAQVKPTMKVACEEVFGPVVVLDVYDKFSEAIERVNDSRYGLQAGVFTDSARLMREAIEGLDVGGVILNEVPTYRADQMPYGGVKESGLGREGIRYAIEEYSERKTVVQWHG